MKVLWKRIEVPDRFLVFQVLVLAVIIVLIAVKI